jgi:Uma2 family endonuclease
MPATTTKLTVEQFQQEYGQQDRAYEFWYGEAIPKGMPTWVHGLLQTIIAQLLREAGLMAASEVELRIDPEAHPKPDVIASRTRRPTGPYPTEGVDVVVEIISEDDTVPRLREKCWKYQKWGCGHIYAVDPSDRSVSEFRDGNFTIAPYLDSVPVIRIWQELDQELEP